VLHETVTMISAKLDSPRSKTGDEQEPVLHENLAFICCPTFYLYYIVALELVTVAVYVAELTQAAPLSVIPQIFKLVLQGELGEV
jgi:hypothetical protein